MQATFKDDIYELFDIPEAGDCFTLFGDRDSIYMMVNEFIDLTGNRVNAVKIVGDAGIGDGIYIFKGEEVAIIRNAKLLIENGLKLMAEWTPLMDAYRLFPQGEPDNTLDYVQSLEMADKYAKANGYLDVVYLSPEGETIVDD